jgi:small multidrug resistance family-3 protein
MNTLIQRVLKAAGKYTVMDYAGLKIALLSLGILLGAYFSNFFLNHTAFLWVVFIVSYVWIMYRTFIKNMH